MARAPMSPATTSIRRPPTASRPRAYRHRSRSLTRRPTRSPSPSPCPRFPFPRWEIAARRRSYVSSCDAGRVASINPVGDVYFAAIPAPVSAFSPTLLNITSATQNGAETTYSYTYSQPVANTPIYLGLMVTITGMSQAADNGTFTVTGLGNGTFTVSNPSGVSSATESGTGIGQPP